ncbi:MAG: sigma-70 family RNA polymerase sigma factor [Bacteroidetes bacterium]|nr:sigma-70 family RNA polymerase sigma factor [Bacteroidota bacterium]
MTQTQNQSIQETVKKESPRLLDFIRRRIPNADDAEDILQDVFYQLVENTRLMKPIEDVGAWLFTVTRNKITDLFRKKKPESLEKQMIHSHEEEGEMLNLSDILPAKNDSPENKMLRSAVTEELEDALDELPKEQREVFMLHEIDGKSFREISELTGESVNTLLSRKRYAVLFLRERLKELYKELLNN